MNNSFGKGLMPDSFSAYKTQRFRWAYGAAQILKRHWRTLAEGSSRLTRDKGISLFLDGCRGSRTRRISFLRLQRFLWSVLLVFKLVEFPLRFSLFDAERLCV